MPNVLRVFRALAFDSSLFAHFLNSQKSADRGAAGRRDGGVGRQHRRELPAVVLRGRRNVFGPELGPVRQRGQHDGAAAPLPHVALHPGLRLATNPLLDAVHQKHHPGKFFLHLRFSF